MDKFEPKETGLKRTLWLFEREILVNLEKTDLKDHHKVLSFNIFSMEYELNPEFDNGRADAIVMRDTANHWLKMWFVAFQTCASEKMQSRQAEINQLQSQINEMAEVGLSQESELNKKDEHAHNLFYENANLQTLVEEKDKRIEELENLMKMQECGANKIYEIALKGVRKTGGDYYLEKIIDLLRGEHANS